MNEIKYSVVFLEYDPNGINRETSTKSLISIIEHSKEYNYELIHVKNVKGFVHAVNDGLSRSKGDYIVVVANDVFIEDYKWLEKFKIDNALCGWRLTPFFITGQLRPDFACWGLSKETFTKLGLMDTQFAEGYGFDDDDYVFRARELGIQIIDVGIELTHLESLTYKTVFKEEKESMTYRNERLFREKWSEKLKSVS